MKELYEDSRNAFLVWRDNNSPRLGPLAENMRRARAIFKHALRRCRAEEANIRAESLSAKLQGGQTKSFWREVRSLNPSVTSLAQRVGDAKGEENIAFSWKKP